MVCLKLGLIEAGNGNELFNFTIHCFAGSQTVSVAFFGIKQLTAGTVIFSAT